MRVLIDKATGTVTVPVETRTIRGFWDGNFTANVLIQKKAALDINWTTVDTITASQMNSGKVVQATNTFYYEDANPMEWRFKHDSSDLSSESGAFGAEILNL